MKRITLLILTIIATMGMATLVAASPGKPTGLRQTKANETSIEVGFTTALNASYEAQISENQSTWSDSGYVNKSYANYSAYGLTPGRTYYVRIRSYEYSGSKKVYSSWSDICSVVTTPEEVRSKSIRQTAATGSSLTIAWDAVSGATSYNIYKSVNNQQYKIGSTTNTSYTVTGLTNKTELNFNYIIVKPVRNNGNFQAENAYDNGIYKSNLRLVPMRSSIPQVANVWSSLREANIKVQQLPFVDTAQIQIFKYNGKTPEITKSNAGVGNYGSNYFNNLKKNVFYKVRSRVGANVNGKTYWSDYSDFSYFATQPKVSLKKANKKLKISWQKVKGATNYSVYVSTSKETGYKKVKTTKKTSFKLKKFKKKNISKKKKYYVYVIANKKVGKKIYQSDKTFCYYR